MGSGRGTQHKNQNPGLLAGEPAARPRHPSSIAYGCCIPALTRFTMMTSRGTSNSPATKPGVASVAGCRYSGRSAPVADKKLESSPSPAYGAVLEWQLGSNALEGSNPSDSAR